jgi:hypothetical protein
MAKKLPYGLVAEFADEEPLLEAAHRAREQGYRQLEAFTPFPVEGLSEALGHKRTLVPLITLLGGIVGGTGGYFMQWWAMAKDYPINIGGRPFNSWPNFIPITFELTILVASLSAVISMLALNRLPELHHPVFATPDFERASTDRFFLWIGGHDPKFDPAATGKFLLTLDPISVTELRQ